MKSSAASVTKSKSTATPEPLFKQFAVPWTPHAGQKKGVKFFLQHACAAMLADPGVGKTTITLAAFKVLKQKGMANKLLVIAPLKPCYLVWPKEVKKWRDFAHFRVEVLHGPKKDEALARDADIYVINPEGLEWLLQAKKTKNARGYAQVTVDLQRFKALGFDVLVVDELSKFKHTSSARFKTLKAVLHLFSRRWGLTGSPAPNGLLDLFGQCYILDQGRSLGQYITHYRQKYFLPSHDGFSWNLRKGADQEIYDRIEPLACRLAAADYVDMPALIHNRIEFNLSPKIQQLYDRLEEDMIANLDGQVITASNAASASMKCRQVVSGGLYLDKAVAELATEFKMLSGKREWAELHQDKIDLLEDLVEELQGSPLLVAYDFNHDLERLQKRFGDVPYIGAGMSMKKVIEIEAAWNRGEIPLLFGHPMSMGHGCNLQECGNHVAWYSMTWDYELYDQFIRRVWRQGNTKQKVFVHHLIARGTVDETMWYTLNAKEKNQTALLDALRTKKR